MAFVLPLDKQPGRTSHDEVAAVRRTLERGVKVGHSGTLDPFATGLLLILGGRATRTQRLFMALDKTYEVTARFGATSTTGDTDGEIVETGVVPSGPLLLRTGRIEQVPPAWSAVKVGGVRSYSLARAGIEPALEPRSVTVHSFEQLWHRGDERGFRVRCSSGTYVRTLISELGDAYCTCLRRTAIGPFQVDEDAGTEIELDEALGRFMETVELPEADGLSLIHGRKVPDPRPGGGGGDGELIARSGGRLVAVVRSDDGVLSTVIGFPDD